MARETYMGTVHAPDFPSGLDWINTAGPLNLKDLRQASLPLSIEHPVVNDLEMRMWSEYGVRAWPTLMLVVPAGDVIWKSEGEITAKQFEPVLQSMLKEFEAKGMLNHGPLDFQPEEVPATRGIDNRVCRTECTRVHVVSLDR